MKKTVYIVISDNPEQPPAVWSTEQRGDLQVILDDPHVERLWEIFPETKNGAQIQNAIDTKADMWTVTPKVIGEMDELYTYRLRQLVELPINQLQEFYETNLTEDVSRTQSIADSLNGLAVWLNVMAAYISGRSYGEKHDTAVNGAEKTYVRVREALRYTLPKKGFVRF